MLCLSLFFISCSGSKYLANPKNEAGVSRSLALYRKSTLTNISYKLFFNIPSEKSQDILATEKLTFHLNNVKHPLQLDFKEATTKLKKIIVNGTTIAIDHKNEHLIIVPDYLKSGSNEISIDFIAGNGALNRNAEYLYTLFVPDRARTVFPCFDQPNLKATYTLSLELPETWSAIANGELLDSTINAARKTFNYRTSDTISSYLFAFAAGKFSRTKGSTGRYLSEFLYRETDTAKINGSLKEVFALHDSALKFLERWTGIPYPFQKFGFVAIPDFQFGGMEHVGNIQYKSSALFLDAGATKDQFNARSNVISHETSHMWFGDMVTMDWFSDVWMKEVFANFMADKSTEAQTGTDMFDLKFLVDHFTLAYGVDRTTGANPIRQNLDNLKDAGTLYGNIIYHKAPIMMRQLERLMGKDKFQEGVREYLRKYRNSNASWPDLIGILDEYTTEDLKAWNKVWVNESGRPLIDYKIETANNKITKLTVSQKAEYGRDRLWPQLIEIKLFYAGGSKEITLNINSANVVVPTAVGLDVPTFILFNSSGQGYGVWPTDGSMLQHISKMENPLNRATAYISVFENMLVGRSMKPEETLRLFVDNMALEKEELNVKLLSNYISNIYWEFLSAEDRAKVIPTLEHSLWDAIQQSSTSNIKKLIFKTFQDVYFSQNARDKIYKIWLNSQSLENIKLTEDDYTSIAFSLALRDDKDSSILHRQLERISNPDRKRRFEFIMPAVSSVEDSRDLFFKSLSLKANREKEANVASALYYLHHPLRQSSSISYLPESLKMLSEIQATGDIFFPQNWLQSTFGYYQSKEAANIVRKFLSENPDYNPKLKAKILQAADNLFKAEQLLNPH
ncbi:MAG: aminopeptidase [Flavobacterium sp.]|nr:MAG: aminopeptidase [Flavobacterium sp.]